MARACTRCVFGGWWGGVRERRGQERGARRARQLWPLHPLPLTLLSLSHTQFPFDAVLAPDASQAALYTAAAADVVAGALAGYHGTVLAYGQTGSGKTYSMTGPDGGGRGGGGRGKKGGAAEVAPPAPHLAGIVPRAVDALFAGLAARGGDWAVAATYVEVYNEGLRDLLAGGRGGKCVLLFGFFCYVFCPFFFAEGGRELFARDVDGGEPILPLKGGEGGALCGLSRTHPSLTPHPLSATPHGTTTTTGRPPWPPPRTARCSCWARRGRTWPVRTTPWPCCAR